MNTIELIEDVCLFGGNLPNERLAEVREFLNKTKAQQLLQTDVSGSVCLDTKLQIKLGELMQQIESSYCYMEKNKLRNKISAICIILDINTFW